jgi:hypothetical protein
LSEIFEQGERLDEKKHQSRQMFQSDKIRADNISRSFIPPSLMLCSEGRGGERAQAKGDVSREASGQRKKTFSSFVHARKREREREKDGNF